MKKKTRSIVRARIFRSYSLGFTLLLLIVFLAGYFAYSHMQVQGKLENYEAISMQMAKELSTRFSRPFQTATQFTYSSWVNRMRYIQRFPSQFEDQISALDIRSQAEQIKLMEVSNGYDERIMLYFSLIDFAISNYGRSSWADYCAYNEFADSNGQPMDISFIADQNHKQLFSGLTMRINGRLRDGLAFVHSISPNAAQSSNVKMVYFMPIDTLAEQAISYYHQEGVSLYLKTSYEEIIPIVQANYSLEVERIFEQYPIGTELAYDRHSGQYILQLPLGEYSLQLLVAFPGHTLFPELRSVQQTFLALYVGVVLLSLLFANLLAYKGYRPLKQLVTNISVDVHSAPETSAVRDEYAMLDLVIHSLRQKAEDLNELQTQQAPMAQRFQLLQALNSPEEDPEALVRILERMLPGEQYLCFLADVLNKETQEMLLDRFKRQSEICYMDVILARHQLIVVSCAKQEPLAVLLREVQALAGEHSLHIGVSTEQKQFAQFRAAYQQAIIALEYHYLMPEKPLILYDEISCREASNVVIRPTDMAALMSAILRGHSDEAVEELQLISKKLVEKQLISVEDYQISMDQVGQQMRLQLLAGHEEYPIRALPSAAKFKNCGLFLNEAAQWLKEQMRIVSSECVAANEALIVNYIRDHLTDPTLSQSQLAEALGYTPSYFSRYFREKFQMGYHEYLAVRRIQLAKQLMAEDKYSIAQLTEKTGFTNDTSFRRVFKSVVGMTPIQYQQQNKQISVSESTQNLS